MVRSRDASASRIARARFPSSSVAAWMGAGAYCGDKVAVPAAGHDWAQAGTTVNQAAKAKLPKATRRIGIETASSVVRRLFRGFEAVERLTTDEMRSTWILL